MERKKKEELARAEVVDVDETDDDEDSSAVSLRSDDSLLLEVSFL